MFPSSSSSTAVEILMFDIGNEAKFVYFSRPLIVRTKVTRTTILFRLHVHQKFIGSERLFYGFRDATRTKVSSSTDVVDLLPLPSRLRLVPIGGCKLNFN